MFEKVYRDIATGIWDSFKHFPALRVMIAPELSGDQLIQVLKGEDEDVLGRLCSIFFFSRSLPDGTTRGGEIRIAGRTLALDPNNGLVLYVIRATNGKSNLLSVGYRDGSSRIPSAIRTALLAEGWNPTGCDDRNELPVAIEQNYYEGVYSLRTNTGGESSPPPRIP